MRYYGVSSIHILQSFTHQLRKLLTYRIPLFPQIINSTVIVNDLFHHIIRYFKFPLNITIKPMLQQFPSQAIATTFLLPAQSDKFIHLFGHNRCVLAIPLSQFDLNLVYQQFN